MPSRSILAITCILAIFSLETHASLETHSMHAPIVSTSCHNRAAGEIICHTLALPLSYHAQEDAAMRVEIIPPPDADGFLPARDGRRQRVPDMAALAAAIAAQSVEPRLDFDHQTERGSPTFRGETAAEGWVRNPALNERGGISADLALSQWAAHRVKTGDYRYLSPALFHANETVTGLSSLALVNDPNFSALRLPDLHAGGPQPGGIADRERQADERDRAAVARTLDTAIEEGRLLPRDREYHQHAISAHAGGIDAGIAAFRDHIKAAVPAGMGDLGRRIGPRGSPAAGHAVPTVDAPMGFAAPHQDRAALHARISAHAAQHNTSYREALIQVAGAQA